MRRDWMQTKHDLGVGGHELNQSATDTLKQAAAEQHLPTINETNPPKVIGEWDEAEIPYGYGYAARKHLGAQHPVWNDRLEAKLEKEWVVGTGRPCGCWSSAGTNTTRSPTRGDRSSAPRARRLPSPASRDSDF